MNDVPARSRLGHGGAVALGSYTVTVNGSGSYTLTVAPVDAPMFSTIPVTYIVTPTDPAGNTGSLTMLNAEVSW